LHALLSAVRDRSEHARLSLCSTRQNVIFLLQAAGESFRQERCRLLQPPADDGEAPMSHNIFVKDYMVAKYCTLRDNLTVEEASQLLPGKTLGIVVNQGNMPISLVRRDQFAVEMGALVLRSPKVPLPPVVIAKLSDNMHTLAQPNIRAVFERGVIGAVVIGGDKEIVGVVPSATMHTFLTSDAYQPAVFAKGGGFAAHPGDSVLGGSTGVPAIHVKCGRCGFVNRLAFLDDRKLPLCQNKKTRPRHRLRLR
jgi:hypothetical protein